MLEETNYQVEQLDQFGFIQFVRFADHVHDARVHDWKKPWLKDFSFPVILLRNGHKLFLEFLEVLCDLLTILDAVHELQDSDPGNVDELSIAFIQVLSVSCVSKVL